MHMHQLIEMHLIARVEIGICIRTVKRRRTARKAKECGTSLRYESSNKKITSVKKTWNACHDVCLFVGRKWHVNEVETGRDKS
jgi:hypothetical protein